MKSVLMFRHMKAAYEAAHGSLKGQALTLEADRGRVYPENGRVKCENGRVNCENGRVNCENGTI